MRAKLKFSQTSGGTFLNLSDNLHRNKQGFIKTYIFYIVFRTLLWFFGHFWNRFLRCLIAVFSFVFEFYQLPQVWESGFWKVRNGRLLGRKCPVSFHKILYNCQVSLLYLNYSRVQKADILYNLPFRIYTKLGRTPQIVPFRILIILHNYMIFTPKSEVILLVGNRFPEFIS